MIQLHFGVKQLKIGKTMGVLDSSAWNYVKYANMEGFCRDIHNMFTLLPLQASKFCFGLYIVGQLS